MEKKTCIGKRSLPAGSRAAGLTITFAVLAVLILAIIGSAQAAETEQHRMLPSGDGGSSDILLAANDAHAVAKKQAKSEPAKEAKEATGLIGMFFKFLGSEPFVFLLIVLAIGYPLGRFSVMGISLGPTAGTLLTGVVLAIIANQAFGVLFVIPDMVSTIFLLMFMYALGVKVGPQFFAGLKTGGMKFIPMAVICWALNWFIVFFRGQAGRPRPRLYRSNHVQQLHYYGSSRRGQAGDFERRLHPAPRNHTRSDRGQHGRRIRHLLYYLFGWHHIADPLPAADVRPRPGG